MDDLRIIELYFNRDEQAIKETDTKYGKLCHSIAYNILNNHEDSEECVNDTYVSVWNTIPPTRPHNFMSFIPKASVFYTSPIVTSNVISAYPSAPFRIAVTVTTSPVLSREVAARAAAI